MCRAQIRSAARAYFLYLTKGNDFEPTQLDARSIVKKQFRTASIICKIFGDEAFQISKMSKIKILVIARAKSIGCTENKRRRYALKFH